MGLKTLRVGVNGRGKGTNFPDPYPWGVYFSCTLGPFSRVRVLRGRGKGPFFWPWGYPCQSLRIISQPLDKCRQLFCLGRICRCTLMDMIFEIAGTLIMLSARDSDRWTSWKKKQSVSSKIQNKEIKHTFYNGKYIAQHCQSEQELVARNVHTLLRSMLLSVQLL